MPNILAGISLGVLGTGVLTAAIAVSVSLTVNGESSQKTPATQNPQPALQKKERKNPEDFNNGCYGGFLSESEKGQLIFCKDVGEGQREELSFYLHWKEKEQNQFLPIEKLNVGSLGSNQWEVWFINNEKQLGNKKIIVNQSGQENLNWMRSLFLKNICTMAKDSSNVSLSCTYHVPHDYTHRAHYTYKHSVTEFKLEQ
ncbi:hypothetical protein WEN_02395 [Mycoplasma wenyonii str. Massachusetts]|uniref:Uncharacterized protein n=1 Tax=Mycoplasma wenyonii (strain Massachusetts) TaxID=1197325 RepID=I6YBB9_MYCWM|nr:hypothetical protein [Mycoplasma wenyonii]AFN65266.1 hypothetical protein WEN_02395 [Mycoplasma wenyonii str. Massachusetts]